MATRKKTRAADPKPTTFDAPPRKRRPVGGSIARSMLGELANSTSVPGKMTPGGVTGSDSAAEVVQDMNENTRLDRESDASASPRGAGTDRTDTPTKGRAKRRRSP